MSKKAVTKTTSPVLEKKVRRSKNDDANIASAKTDRAQSAPSSPLLPSPAVLKLEESVLDIVSKREPCSTQVDLARARVRDAAAALTAAESDLRLAEQRLQQTDVEVQYRMDLIRQMKGEAPRMTLPAVSIPSNDSYASVSISEIPPGVASIPSRSVIDGGHRVRSESAEAMRTVL